MLRKRCLIVQQTKCCFPFVLFSFSNKEMLFRCIIVLNLPGNSKAKSSSRVPRGAPSPDDLELVSEPEPPGFEYVSLPNPLLFPELQPGRLSFVEKVYEQGTYDSESSEKGPPLGTDSVAVHLCRQSNLYAASGLVVSRITCSCLQNQEV